MILKPIEIIWTSEGHVTVRQNPLHVLYEKYYSKCIKPPIHEIIEYMRKIGKTEKDIEQRMKEHLAWKKNSEKEQEKLDAMFAKYKIKTPSKKTKVLKPVKKL